MTTQEEWETPFNARGFEFDLENVLFPLPDNVHKITADKVFISSLTNQVDLRNFELSGDKKKESKAYYSAKLNALRIGNVDLNQAFMTSRLLVDEIIMEDPFLR
ncbi:hypothetical protein V8V91_18090 [Algoriphagus halophilus]|uniref:hypothetical protein n=1 Tax=Algoriphagus halophilus TaxID=226505 RepID=UPI00358E02E7